MLKQTKINEILADYRDNGSIAATAKKHDLSWITVKKYIEAIKNIDINTKKEIEIELLDDPSQLPSPIYNINNNIYKEDINNNNLNNINNSNNINITDSTSTNIKPQFNSKYIDKIQGILDLAIKRYKKEYKNVHPNYISKDIGIFTDKLLRLYGENTERQDIKTIIFNNFGTNKDMLELITQIQLSKNKLANE